MTVKQNDIWKAYKKLLKREIDTKFRESDLTGYKLEAKIGVPRQTIMRFLNGTQDIMLDTGLKLMVAVGMSVLSSDGTIAAAKAGLFRSVDCGPTVE
jgi:hypothetical protein